MKILKYKTIDDKIKEIIINQNEENTIINFLSGSTPNQQFIFKGVTMKAINMQIAEKEGYKQSDGWSDEELKNWETDIFSNGRKTFKEYLVFKDCYVINDEYPSGAVRNSKVYLSCCSAWSLLTDLRFRERMNEQGGKEIYLKHLEDLRDDINKMIFEKGSSLLTKDK